MRTSRPIAVRVAAFAIASLAPAGAALADPAPAASAGSPVVLEGAEQVDLRSAAGSEHRVFVYVPPGEAPAAGWPAYYFTDANVQFGAALSLARIQQRLIGPVVLVGIGYPTEDRAEIAFRRTFDLTPATSPEVLERLRERRAERGGGSGPGGGAQPGAPAPNAPRPPAPPNGLPSDDRPPRTGGNEAFFTFIQTVVKPWVAARTRVDPAKQVLFGHSYGGLFALHVLLAHPDAFSTVVAASASLWLNPAAVADDFAAFAAARAKGVPAPRLLMTVGSLEPMAPGGPRPDARPGPHKPDAPNPDVPRPEAPVPEVAPSPNAGPAGSGGGPVPGAGAERSREAFVERLRAAGVDVTFRTFDGENHGSVIPFAHMAGLRFAFETR